jgi:acetolactate synthase-1/2/3 large subunit
VDYAQVARALGCDGVAVDHAADLRPALGASILRGTRPTVIDVRVTRDPARMLPGVDSRTVVDARG